MYSVKRLLVEVVGDPLLQVLLDLGERLVARRLASVTRKRWIESEVTTGGGTRRRVTKIAVVERLDELALRDDRRGPRPVFGRALRELLREVANGAPLRAAGAAPRPLAPPAGGPPDRRRELQDDLGPCAVSGIA
jgi:hypothetical protein